MRIPICIPTRKGESHFRDMKSTGPRSGGSQLSTRCRHRQSFSARRGRLRPRLASRAAPSIHREPGQRGADHCQRRGKPYHRGRRSELVEDTTGKGHLSQWLGEMRHSLFIPVDYRWQSVVASCAPTVTAEREAAFNSGKRGAPAAGAPLHNGAVSGRPTGRW